VPHPKSHRKTSSPIQLLPYLSKSWGKQAGRPSERAGKSSPEAKVCERHSDREYKMKRDCQSPDSVWTGKEEEAQDQRNSDGELGAEL
jgi:hypothetical protein